ncbi:membrane-bound transcription factor site-2 protease-like [Uloborus diversus]|uniref:membrane-bound transcription factor site-2 protease-like n=1 Tax=Uloborus diversus TaxID=327109 RepID=UPI002409D384|nr:membrane-bound transcription factor site-2 protease-like [Uloborus diversus]
MLTFILIIMTWCVVSFIDLIFKTCLFFPYLQTLNQAGIHISPFKISWSSSHIPRGLLSSVQKRPKLYRTWEQVNVESYGCGVLVIFPWAFTNLNREQLMSLSDWQKLRIYAAGVWHNVVLSIIAAVLLISSPYLLLPIYSYGQGVTVLRAENNINGSTAGLKAGDQIFSINDCPVTDIVSWEKCLTIISIEKEACLPGRDAIVNSHFCDFNSNCEKQSFCLVPLSSKVSDRFLEIHRNGNDSVLFVGLVEELSAYVNFGAAFDFT